MNASLLKLTNSKGVLYTIIFIILSVFACTESRIHHLTLVDDFREQITISTYGFLKNGLLQLSVKNLRLYKQTSLESVRNSLSFVLEKTNNDGFSSFTASDKSQDFCSIIEKFFVSENKKENVKNKEQLNKEITAKLSEYLIKRLSNQTHGYSLVVIQMDLVENQGNIIRIGKHMQNLRIKTEFHDKFGIDASIANTSFSSEVRKDNLDFNEEPPLMSIPIIYSNQSSSYSFKFEIKMNSYEEEGLYKLNLFNCYSALSSVMNVNENTSPRSIQKDKLYFADTYYLMNDVSKFGISLDLDLLERNEESFLSAGEMPEPTLYLTWSIIYFLAAISWMYILRTSKGDVFKIHYFMLGLVFIKSISLTFHAINMHYIAMNGRHEAVWAILYYITYVLRGLLLIISILLVGTGWTFIKHVLSENERRLFVIIIPLQILAIIAYIFLEEKEEGDAVYLTWRQLFFLLDLVCCGAILFPVVWSIKHLEQAAKTDGKMVHNLKKLKIFKHFYIMVICYIYFTRIIGFLLKQVLPFRYEWFDELSIEIVTFIFFTMTAYKFQPTSKNPYLQLNQDDELNMDDLESYISGDAQTVLDLIEQNQNDEKNRHNTTKSLTQSVNSPDSNLSSRSKQQTDGN